MGGLIGTVLTGIFTTSFISQFDETTTLGGVVDGKGLQLGYQLVAVAVIPLYSFSVSYLILTLMELCGLELRSNEQDELDGIDIGEMGEIAYDMVPLGDKV